MSVHRLLVAHAVSPTFRFLDIMLKNKQVFSNEPDYFHNTFLDLEVIVKMAS